MVKYIIRRSLMIIPMVFLISVIAFLLIELPPGDYLTVRIKNLEDQGVILSQAEILTLTKQYGLDKPVYARYFRWIENFILRGDLGISFQYERPVMDLIRERLPATIMMVVMSLTVSWVIAIPLGIYSATHQYSVFDYIFTFLAFLGVGTPGFLLAMIVALISITVFNFSPIGLMSVEFAGKPWDWAKFIDVMKHIWFPVMIMAIGGTGRLMRTMRNNLLDELKKQYVMTAHAKGLHPVRLILKYPVRLALNPVIVGTASILPQLFAGGGMIAIVLGLETIGPLLLNAVLSQDMYVAGSILTIMGFLIILGNFLSDLLLAVVDPRVRFGSGVTR